MDKGLPIVLISAALSASLPVKADGQDQSVLDSWGETGIAVSDAITTIKNDFACKFELDTCVEGGLQPYLLKQQDHVSDSEKIYGDLLKKINQ